jgi:hypothetical protein
VLLLALVIALSALGLSGLLWQKLDFTQQELARRSQDSGAVAVEARTLASQAEALTQELQARLSVAEVRLSEVSLQRTQLEELMLTLSRSRDDNLVQDLESALRLAQQQTELTTPDFCAAGRRPAHRPCCTAQAQPGAAGHCPRHRTHSGCVACRHSGHGAAPGRARPPGG